MSKEFSGRTVFIPHDFMTNEVLADVAGRLEARGVEVVRGPESRPGEKVSYPKEHWPEWFGRAEVAMFSSRNVCTREMLEYAPRLVGVVNPTIGLETVDVPAATELGIIVGHGATPQNFLGMAESTIMLMLMSMYRPLNSSDVLHGRRPRPKPTPADSWGRMMLNRTVGLVGFGRIARGVAERLQGWNMRILAADPYAKPETVPAYVQLTELDTLLRESDIVSVLVAITPETRGIIGEREISLMKPDACIINTARGDAIDEPALIRALQAKRIAYAALDTFQVEPPAPDNPLRAMTENTFLTPHMVGHTKDVFASFGPAAEENITRILKGEPPLYCKNPEVIPKWRERMARIAAAR